MRNDLKREQQKAIKKAFSAATQADTAQAQYWLNRASQFWPVTKRQRARIQAELLEEIAFQADVKRAAEHCLTT